MKDKGVKKIMILAIVEDVQENYENILKIWLLFGLKDSAMKFKISCDLKLANIILGLMSHSSNHPCTWCDSKRDNLYEKGELRNLQNTINRFWEWHAAGETMKNA